MNEINDTPKGIKILMGFIAFLTLLGVIYVLSIPEPPTPITIETDAQIHNLGDYENTEFRFKYNVYATLIDHNMDSTEQRQILVDESRTLLKFIFNPKDNMMSEDPKGEKLKTLIIHYPNSEDKDKLPIIIDSIKITKLYILPYTLPKTKEEGWNNVQKRLTAREKQLFQKQIEQQLEAKMNVAKARAEVLKKDARARVVMLEQKAIQDKIEFMKKYEGRKEEAIKKVEAEISHAKMLKKKHERRIDSLANVIAIEMARELSKIKMPQIIISTDTSTKSPMQAMLNAFNQPKEETFIQKIKNYFQ